MTKTKYKFLGTTDTVTTCDCCGKQNLKKTCVLSYFDQEGNLVEDDPSFFGSSCVWNFLSNNNQYKEAERARKGKNQKYTPQVYQDMKIRIYNNQATYSITLLNGEFYGHSIIFDDTGELPRINAERANYICDNYLNKPKHKEFKNALEIFLF